jgi:sugar/nucleoside kinase (ribokinase family)
VEPIAIVGHVAIDRIITCGGEWRQLGGPPTYVSLITNLLGVHLTAATKVGGDFPNEYVSELATRGLDIRGSIVSSAETTRFVLDYTGPERGLGYESLCVPIAPQDVEELPDAAIIAPIVGEIPRETLRALKSRTLALDPQGFVRKLEPGGSISLQPWCNMDLLSHLSVLKASERELHLVAGERGWAGLEKLVELGVKIAIETHGGEGAYVRYADRKMIVPSYSGETVDTTGAGDVFIASFFQAYAAGEDVEWCAALGSAAASAVVETVGPRIKIIREELFDRAEKVHDGIRCLS